MPTAPMYEAIDLAAADIDTQNRAWVVAVGRLVDNEDAEVFSEDQIASVLAKLYASGDFPNGPLAYTPESEHAEINPNYHMVTVTHQRNGMPFLESKIAFGIAGYVAHGFTRSGWLDETTCEPSHVLLVDVEAAIADMTSLLYFVAEELGYQGVCAGIITTACSIPDRPLRLRAFDERTGDLKPVETAPSEFTPVTFHYDLAEHPSRRDFHQMCWDAAKDVAKQFGVRNPQLFVNPAVRTPRPGEM